MIRKLKMLILKIVFSPLWLFAGLCAILYTLHTWMIKGWEIAQDGESSTETPKIKELLQVFEYWRL